MTREDALRWAAEARAVRAEVVDGLSSGTTTLGEVLHRAASDPLVGRIHAVAVLESLPDWGKVACRRALADAGIDESSPISALDPSVVLERFGSAQ